MNAYPLISLEQWRTLVAVVEAEGYAQAALLLNKTQSTITYAVQKIESLLNVQVFEIQGRKAILTPTGQMLYRRAKLLVEEATRLERATRHVSAGWEVEITLAVEILFPTHLVLKSLGLFGEKSPYTRIEVIESVLGGTAEALIQGKADMAISPHIPPGFTGEPLMRMNLRLFAHPAHPLHQLNRPVTLQDLRQHRHLVIRDSGLHRERSKVSMEINQRWTFSHMKTSIEAASQGYGFAWLPEVRVQEALALGLLKPLSLEGGSERWVELYLILADPDAAGPGVHCLMECIKSTVIS